MTPRDAMAIARARVQLQPAGKGLFAVWVNGLRITDPAPHYVSRIDYIETVSVLALELLGAEDPGGSVEAALDAGHLQLDRVICAACRHAGLPVAPAHRRAGSAR